MTGPSAGTSHVTGLRGVRYGEIFLITSQAGRSQVRRILLAEKVRWRRTRSWTASTDPEFAPKGPGSWSSIPPRRRAPS